MDIFPEWVYRRYPNLDRAGFKPKSPKDPSYNCVAYVAGCTDDIWQESWHWPSLDTRGFVAGLIDVLQHEGFETCLTGSLEPGYEKVAIYAANDFWKHVAKQLPDGSWTSKLGWKNEDIIHATPECLVSEGYGKIAGYMKRPLTSPPVA